MLIIEIIHQAKRRRIYV